MDYLGLKNSYRKVVTSVQLVIFSVYLILYVFIQIFDGIRCKFTKQEDPNYGHKKIYVSTDPPSSTRVQHSFRSLNLQARPHTRTRSLSPPHLRSLIKSASGVRHPMDVMHVLHAHQRVMVPQPAIIC